jgi:hypothetical protein
MDQLRIFVSSTCYDLSQIRSDLFDFISNQGHKPILSEYSSFPINPDGNTIENCIRNVKENTDIFILIIGNRYGSQIENNKSITNTEYIYAKEAGIPIFVYTLKQLVTILPLWKKNPSANFSEYVDSVKIFEFVETVREIDKRWCFNFENAQDIIASIKVQLSHLFKDSLDISRKYSGSMLPKFWEQISPEAVKILVKKQEMYELLFFAQTLEDELKKFEDLKLDIDYQIILESYERLSDRIQLVEWLQKQMTTLHFFMQSCSNLLDKAFPKFHGEPGIPSDLKGLYYVSKAFAKLVKNMLTWSINIKSTSVED